MIKAVLVDSVRFPEPTCTDTGNDTFLGVAISASAKCVISRDGPCCDYQKHQPVRLVIRLNVCTS